MSVIAASIPLVHLPRFEAPINLSESRDEEDCIGDLQQILDLLNSMGTPPAPTNAQLKELCFDLKQLMDIKTRLAQSGLNDDKAMAQNIDQLLTAPFGSNTLESAANAFLSGSDSDATQMTKLFSDMIKTGSFSSLVGILGNLIQNPPWAPPKA